MYCIQKKIYSFFFSFEYFRSQIKGIHRYRFRFVSIIEASDSTYPRSELFWFRRAGSELIDALGYTTVDLELIRDPKRATSSP